MSERLRYAVITTRDRPGEFARCLTAIGEQVDGLVCVAHMEPSYIEAWDSGVIFYDEDPPNISRMWNLGLEAVAKLADGQPYDVAVLNDDAIVPPDWFERITEGMHLYGAVAGSADQHGRVPAGLRLLNNKPAADDLLIRMSGFAFILDGTAGLSLDEQFQWWAGDRDLEMVARTRGGTVLVGGCPVEHLHPNSTTIGELARIAGEDMERFRVKWGFGAD